MSEVIDESQFADADEHVEFLQAYLLAANYEIKEQQSSIDNLKSSLNIIVNEFCGNMVTPYQEKICSMAIRDMNYKIGLK